jgi:hypothetical protein
MFNRRNSPGVKPDAARNAAENAAALEGGALRYFIDR